MQQRTNIQTRSCIAAGLIALTSLALNVCVWGQTTTGKAQSIQVNNTTIEPASAQPSEVQLRARVGQQLDRLMAKAKKDGSIRVIVHPRGDFQLTPEMDQSQRNARQSRITTARDEMVTRVRSQAQGAIHTYEHAPFIVFEVDEFGLQMLKSLPEIERVEEDITFKPLLADSTPLIGATQAWNAGYTGKGQVIVIADTGVDKSHPFLSGKVVREMCFSSGAVTSLSLCPNGMPTQDGNSSATPPSSSYPGYFHGTYTAGIAAGKGVNFSGVAKDAQIIAIQVFHLETNALKCGGVAPCLHTSNSDLQAAALWVASHRANPFSPGIPDTYNIAAINLSLGSGEYKTNCDALDPNDTSLYSLGLQLASLKSSGVAVVASSGNENYPDALGAPACLSSVISVGASTKDDKVWTGSNSASFLNLLAPGANITSSVPGAQYGTYSGTSAAAPHVAGAIAVLRSKEQKVDVDTMLNLLKTTGVGIKDPKNNLTKPRIDLGAAVTALCGGTLSATGKTFYNDGGTGQFTLSQAGYCSWKPTTATSWIQITSPTTTVTGNAIVSYKVSAWPWSAGGIQTQRTGYITAGGRTYKVTQIRVD
ncbi:MAG: S8 family serine peptidase [Blastocatellia bacterium]